MVMDKRVFRQRLQNIISEEQIKLHETKVLQLASKFEGAFIMPIHRQSENQHAFNCFMHVLNLADRITPNVVEQEGKKFRFIVNSSLFRKFYDAGLLSEISLDQLEPNDLIVYYNGQEKMHAGRYIAPNLVESKWGVGPLFRHGLWNVPKSYGDSLRYFKKPVQAKVDAFIKQELPNVELAPLEPVNPPASTDLH